MNETVSNIAGRACHIVTKTAYTPDEDVFASESNASKAVIVKPLGEFEWRLLLDECNMISELTSVPFIMVAFEVTEQDLRPVGAENTFRYLANELLPYIRKQLPHHKTVLGGYSLGGLFALWSATQLEGIDAVFAGSPSLWMEGWDEYAASHPTKAKYVYMCLGDKEECTRKKPFSIIGDRVRAQHQLHIQKLGSENCILQWHPGGHFANIEQRKAQGFAWCLDRIITVS